MSCGSDWLACASKVGGEQSEMDVSPVGRPQLDSAGIYIYTAYSVYMYMHWLYASLGGECWSLH